MLTAYGNQHVGATQGQSSKVWLDLGSKEITFGHFRVLSHGELCKNRRKNHPARCDAGHAWHAIDDAEHHAWYAPNGVHDGHGADARPRIGGLVTRV